MKKRSTNALGGELGGMFMLTTDTTVCICLMRF